MRHVLVDANLNEVKPETVIKTFRGEEYILKAFKVPHNDRSTGRVIVKKPNSAFEQEFYPGVFDLTIREIKD